MGVSCVCCGLFYSQVFLHLKSPNNTPKESTATAPLCFRHYSHSTRAGVPNTCVGGVSSVAGTLVFTPKKGLESLLSIQQGASVGRRSPANGKPERHILLRSLFEGRRHRYALHPMKAGHQGNRHAPHPIRDEVMSEAVPLAPTCEGEGERYIPARLEGPIKTRRGPFLLGVCLSVGPVCK